MSDLVIQGPYQRRLEREERRDAGLPLEKLTPEEQAKRAQLFETSRACYMDYLHNRGPLLGRIRIGEELDEANFKACYAEYNATYSPEMVVPEAELLAASKQCVLDENKARQSLKERGLEYINWHTKEPANTEEVIKESCYETYEKRFGM